MVANTIMPELLQHTQYSLRNITHTLYNNQYVNDDIVHVIVCSLPSTIHELSITY